MASRNEIRRKVICTECGRTLSGVAAYSSSGWHLPRHKTPDKRACWGSRSTKHRPADTEAST